VIVIEPASSLTLYVAALNCMNESGAGAGGGGGVGVGIGVGVGAEPD